MTSPAIVPRIVAKVALIAAIRRLSNEAYMICSLLNNSSYQRREKPPQTDMIAELLNEKRIKISIGTYKNAKPKHIHEKIKVDDRYILG